MPRSRPGTTRVGLGGWTYAPWRGTFFPDTLPHRRELEHAATRLTALEINATYYGRQKPETFARWAAAVPDDHDDLARFPALLPPSIADRPAHHVIEARHPSFADTGFIDLMRDHNVAIAHVDRVDASPIDAVTADFRYARLERVTLSEPTGYPPPNSTTGRPEPPKPRRPATTPTSFSIAGDKVRNPQAAKALIARLPTAR